jgi:hypothetical protein
VLLPRLGLRPARVYPAPVEHKIDGVVLETGVRYLIRVGLVLSSVVLLLILFMWPGGLVRG